MNVNINIPKPVIDYNDLENKPTLISEHSELTLNDGTNPHGTTKTDIGLSNVNNTSDADKPISTATQTALNLKANISDISAVGFSNDYDDLDNLPDLKLATFTIELLDLLSVDFYAPNDLKINTTTVINGLGVVSLQVNDLSYTLGTVINQGDKITVSVDTASVVNLNSRYE